MSLLARSVLALLLSPIAAQESPGASEEQQPARQDAAMQKIEGLDNTYRLSAALGDVDGDGIEDLVVGRNGRFGVRRGLSRKPRRFAAIEDLGRSVGPTCESAGEPRLVDVDEDGDLDLLTLDAGLPFGVGSDVRVVWMPNDGKGRFGSAKELAATGGKPLQRSGEPSTVQLVDWDGDGHRDLLVATPHLRIHRGTADGLAAESVPLGPMSRGFVVVDWNADGRMDLLTQHDDQIQLHQRASGELAATPVRKLQVHLTALRLGSADWNLDGKPDLLVGNHDRLPGVKRPAAVVAEEKAQIEAAERILALVELEVQKLNRTPPPRGDDKAMVRRREWRDQLQAWAKGPRELRHRLQTCHRSMTQPTHHGVVRVLLN